MIQLKVIKLRDKRFPWKFHGYEASFIDTVNPRKWGVPWAGQDFNKIRAIERAIEHRLLVGTGLTPVDNDICTI